MSPNENNCTSCGSPLRENARFCTKCGSPVSVDYIPSTVPTYSTDPTPPISTPDVDPAWSAQPSAADGSRERPSQDVSYPPPSSYPAPAAPAKKSKAWIIILIVVLLCLGCVATIVVIGFLFPNLLNSAELLNSTAKVAATYSAFA